MRGKELVTIACMLAILGGGACFFAPIHEPKPPPPPIIDLQGSRTLCVIVENRTATQHVDAARLARAVADRINEYQAGNENRGAKLVTARACAEPAAGDVVLRAAIVNEEATAVPVAGIPEAVNWTLRVTIDATLIAADGRVLRQVTGSAWPSRPRRLPANTANPWDSPVFASWKEYSLSLWLMMRMLDPNGGLK